MFYDVLKAEDNLQFNGQSPFFGSAFLGFSAPDGGFTSDPGILTNPFAAAGAVNPFPSKPVNHNVNFADAGDLPIGGGNPFFVDPHLKTPYIYQYNLSVQQQLVNNLTLRGRLCRLPGARAHRPDRHQPVRARHRHARAGPEHPGFQGDYNFMNEFQNVGRAKYNALQFDLTKRMSNSSVGQYVLQARLHLVARNRQRVGLSPAQHFVPYYNHYQFMLLGRLRHAADPLALGRMGNAVSTSSGRRARRSSPKDGRSTRS